MTRRSLLLLTPCLAWAGAAEDAHELLSDFTTHLAAGNGDLALRLVDPAMQGFAEFQTRIRALVLRYEVQSSLEILRNEGGETERSLEIDWMLQLRARDDTAGIVRRRESVKCGVRKVGRRWKFVAFAPQALFDV
jgi:hypothetical protein